MPGLEPRNNSPPCPDADGTAIGSQLRFNLFCASSIEGETLDTLDASSLPECVELCANFHPRCDAVTYSDRDRCRLKRNIVPEDTRPSRLVDGAAALYPELPPSGCTNGQQSMGGGQYEIMCGQVAADGDMVQRHHRTMAECAADCAVQPGCAGFSFDASLDMGFMNCYLKSSIPGSALAALDGIDTGILNAAVDTPEQAPQEPQPPPAQDAPQENAPGAGTGTEQPVANPQQGVPAGGGVVAQDPVTVTQPAETVTEVLPDTTLVVERPPQTVTLLPSADEDDPNQVPGFNTIPQGQTTSGGFFFTPTGGVAVTGVSTRTLVSLSTSASSVISVTRVVTVPVTSFGPAGTNGVQTQNDGDGGGENLAWVAAPVVGGIAAVLVVVVMFVMFRKKRRNGARGGNGSGSGESGGMMSSLGFVSKRKMPDLSGASGMLGFWKPKRAGAERLDDSYEKSTPRYEVKGGRSVLTEGSSPQRPMTGLFRSRDS